MSLAQSVDRDCRAGDEPGQWRRRRWPLAAVLVVSIAGCGRFVPHEGIVFTEAPIANARAFATPDSLENRYPAGTRIMLADPDFRRLQVLSAGLLSAGNPQVSPDGRRVVFCAKATVEADWQIYELQLERGRYRRLTDMPGGACDPGLLPDGRFLFVSPAASTEKVRRPCHTLYAQAPGQAPRALTFTTMRVSDPAVLADGRVLFVGTHLDAANGKIKTCALYTINNDGTEITKFSSLEEGAVIRQPRLLSDKRIACLTSEPGRGAANPQAEFIRLAQPFAAPEHLALACSNQLVSVRPGANGELLICAESASPMETNREPSAIYRLGKEVTGLGSALFSEPGWDCVEATAIAKRPEPMGRLSMVDLSKRTGQILCLDVNYTSSITGTATRVRVSTQTAGGEPRTLGEVPVQADGSFMAEVPADVPLGLEALDDHGRVLRRLAPTFWVRPGENRSCIGCHEPPNHSPRNHRPLAVRAPVPRLTLETPSLAKARP